ncbi:MAG: hydrogenase maturation nickel metallochaperone HypA [Candidatus Eremiobacteraeota bacterium]|nr:hydrogenase maturation nickel metallochaperone HypA [Candidatus Eremiobacteraeota bacterium]
MHEVSIALSLVDGLTEQAAQRGVRKIEAVHVRIGSMAGVVKDSLLFAWELVCADTVAAGSRLVIEDVPLVVYCTTCQNERTLHGIPDFQCPVCGKPTPEIVRGRELQVVAMEVPNE